MFYCFRLTVPTDLLIMHGGFHHNFSFETNGTTPGSANHDQYSEKLENIYQSVQPVLSWMLVVTGVIGIPGNVLTIMVFAKMGTASTFQMSCMGLAVSDLLCVGASMMCGITTMGVFRGAASQAAISHLNNLVGGLPQVVFSRVTSLITAWISTVRCLSVAYPTKVRFIITRTVTTVALCIIFSLGCSFLLIASTVYRVKREFDPETNSTVWTLDFQKDSKSSAFFQFLRFVFGLILPVLSWVTVTVCTTFLIVKLKQNAKWKSQNAQVVTESSSSGAVPSKIKQKKELPERERRVMKVVILVAVIFLFCSVPMSAHLVASFTLPQYKESGSLRHLFIINGLVCVFMSQLNSSINIVLFAISGQNFRSALLSMFRVSKP